MGRRTGNERPPYDPYSAQDASGKGGKNDGNDTVVQLPRDRVSRTRQPDDTVEIEERLSKFAPRGSELSKGLAALVRSDQDFDPEEFLGGAKAAYEMIVMAFAEGNKRTLKQLLSRDVYDEFASAISQREERTETVETSFVGIEKANMIEAELRNKTAQITVKFVSDLITATRGKDGKIIDGDPKKVREVTDIWTFARDVTSGDPNWKLVATGAEN